MTVSRCAFLLLLAASLAACNRQNTPAPPAPAIEASVSRCPSQTFEGFFAEFSDSTEVQKAFTRLPLRSESIDVGAEPEPKPITRMLSAQELDFPLLPSKQKIAEERLEISFKTQDNDRVVELSKPDTDYMISYYFERAGDCWRLYRKNDASF